MGSLGLEPVLIQNIKTFPMQMRMTKMAAVASALARKLAAAVMTTAQKTKVLTTAIKALSLRATGLGFGQCQ